jgi:sulfonate transport system permease protein
VTDTAAPATLRRTLVRDQAGPSPDSRVGGRRRRLTPGTPVPGRVVIGPLVLLGVWAAGSGLGLLDPRILPSPWSIVATGADLVDKGTLQRDLLVSLVRAATGLALGLVAGIVLALVSGLTRLGEVAIDGPVQVKRAIPSLALIPLLILWFGIGEWMKIITIALGVLVPIYLHTHNGLRSIDSRYVELAETVGLSRSAFVRRVILPGALPGFLLGLRFAVTGSWLSLVVVEQVNATSGIGYMMTLARAYGQIDVIFVGLAIYAVFGLLSDTAVRSLSRKALSWRRTLAD